jgi:N-acetylglucosamine-6-sulfatase
MARVQMWIGLIIVLVGGIDISAEAQDTKQRNIVFILVDDQRWDAIGKLNPYFDTPHLDTLMDNGVYFPNMFVTTSLCSPSRASFLTGQWAHKHGVLNNSTRLNEQTPTFPQELQKAGYETAFTGKWHMGGTSDKPRAGFDRWVSFRGQGVYFNQNFNVDGKMVKSSGHNTDIVTDYAEEFIRKDHDKPFMLYVSHKAVHADFKPAKRHQGSYKGKMYPYPDTMADTEENYKGKPRWVKEQRDTWHGVDGLYNNTMDLDDFTQRYAETMRTVDDSVGRIVQVLKDEGILDSTLLIFTSDNGFQFGEHGLIDKRTMYEASIKIPLIVHCPDLFKGGQVRDQMVLNVDLFPTLMDVAGAKTPESVQGESWWPIVNDGNVKGRESFLYTYFWERMFAQTPTVLGVRTNTHKYMQFHGTFGRYELYDIQNDPDEKHNLIGDFYTRQGAGDVSARMRNKNDVGKENNELYFDLLKKLNAHLDELDCEREPNWRPIN